ncbi:isopentenyl transferase [Streptomyces sp. ISL-22]|uniref:isopentenyl transferase family protein n=1 Tax=unclassified Streptomyces TaxID=2593676 RepID=UPI001BE50306|nr:MULTISPECIES: isopentenyl transferase family protein [unclassified Streptomyces]MBT2419446.1 isopentenyl transferase [Streptomyces sp. ISL-24]MBT2437759.1 isopentenyl transferase [Streptomyces sp. ISL-22]
MVEKETLAVDRPFVHLIAGPTGVGKSAAATELARATGAPIVVADRLQCFTDLATTSARAGAEVPGVCRHWLGDRTFADGDLSAAEAGDALVDLVERLAPAHPLVIVEGGSISLLRELCARRSALRWRLTVRLLPLPARDEYLATLTRRARAMLTPGACGPGLLQELAALWRDPRKRLLAASVNGFEAVLECCAKYSLDVASIDEQDIPGHVQDRIAALIAERHAEHGFLQHRVFTEIFEKTSAEFDLGLLEDAA